MAQIPVTKPVLAAAWQSDALDTGTIQSLKYTAKFIMSFRRPDGTETEGIFSLGSFRF